MVIIYLILVFFFVEWSLKGSSDEIFILIDSNVVEYKGIINFFFLFGVSGKKYKLIRK